MIFSCESSTCQRSPADRTLLEGPELMAKKKKTQPKRKSLRVLGMMTGTSCDGLDGACLDIDSEGWQPVWSGSLPYPGELRRRVMAVQAPGSRHSLSDLLALDRD